MASLWRCRGSKAASLSAVLPALLLASQGSSAVAADTQSSVRPPALEGRTGCELWVGTVSGNDPSVLVEALICEGMNRAVTGQLQWSSLTSGYSVRDISGNWSEDHAKLSLHDTKIVVNKPNPTWVFCAVDQYDLTRAGDKLAGSYRSQKCNDTAAVRLTKKVQPEIALPPPVDDPAPSEPDEHAPEIEVTRKAPLSSCLCGTTRNQPSTAGGWLAMGALALAVRRARPSTATNARGRRSPRHDSSR